MPKEEFRLAMEELIATMTREVYRPLHLMSMVKSGAVEAAHSVVGKATPTPGFQRLYKAKRLDLSVENLILDSRWASEFEDLLELPRNRLNAYGFTPTH